MPRRGVRGERRRMDRSTLTELAEQHSRRLCNAGFEAGERKYRISHHRRDPDTSMGKND
jgi:hypothetical protein